ncbi:uncharacterized protein LOC122507239 [Leptopilina heterotoma]|uniref:uncharacterized protein LOC122507239 n=1 Tax=Leptopilina heterotoma TaxID=63436 RepID=UPI001CA8EC0A|nr:uncharacterized protein LOC122507239 [Leptopilina heterotoma]
MYKWRNRNCPPAVHSLQSYTQEVNSDNWKHLLQCKRGTMNVSLVVGEDSSESVIFMNPEFVRETSVRGFFFIDSTFKTVPHGVGAQQFLTIVSCKYNHAVPCVWILMDRKSKEAYKAVFEEISRLIPEFIIDEAMTDYESALKAALRAVFPNIILHGCWFHYKQALLRKAIKLGLRALLKYNEDAKHLLLLIMDLPLLPACF